MGPEEYGYDEPPPEDQEQEQGAPEEADDEEESYDYEWGGEEYQEEPEPPENNESMVKTIVSVMRQYAEQDAKEPQAEQSMVATATLTIDTVNLSSLALEQEKTSIKSSTVLLDGGASLHVYYSPSVPKGAVKREVELAHGTKTGYVQGSDITFIDKSVSEEQAKIPAIVSLGRLIQKGIKLEWTKIGALLVLPNKKRSKIPVRNNCPYASKEVLRIVKRLREFEEKHRVVRTYFAQLYSVLKVRLCTQSELDTHRRQGHIQYSPDCPECKRGVARQRAHHRAETRAGGELSIDIGGPYPVGIPVSDQPHIAQHRYPRYMLVGVLFV